MRRHRRVGTAAALTALLAVLCSIPALEARSATSASNSNSQSSDASSFHATLDADHEVDCVANTIGKPQVLRCDRYAAQTQDLTVTISGGKTRRINAGDSAGTGYGPLLAEGETWRAGIFKCSIARGRLSCSDTTSVAGFALTSSALTITGQAACPDFYVVDSRGSGEEGGTISPPGARLVAAFKSLETGTSVKALPNGYAARGGFSILAGAKLKVPGAYFNSVNSGKVWLTDAISRLRTQCSEAKLILTGYSQGAQVTGDVVQQYAKLPPNVAAVVLFGDPYFNGRDSAVDRGNPRYRTGVNGGLGKRPTFKVGHVLSYCHSNDPVCQNTANPIAAFIWHNNYDKLLEPAEAAKTIVKWLKPTGPRHPTPPEFNAMLRAEQTSGGSLPCSYPTNDYVSAINPRWAVMTWQPVCGGSLFTHSWLQRATPEALSWMVVGRTTGTITQRAPCISVSAVPADIRCR
jgi:hypothetical protein